MTYNLVDNIEYCFLLVRDSYPLSMIYYSHWMSIVIALIVGLFVILNNRKSLEARLLFILSLIFSVWVFFNFILWTSSNSTLIMTLWAFSGILIMFLFIFSLYLTHVFINKKDIGFVKKIILGIVLLPIIFLTPTIFNLSDFSIVNDCEASENPYFTNYYYLFGLLVFIWILIMVAIKYRSTDQKFKKQVLLFTAGVEFFLFSFFASGYIASLTEYYELEFYGIFAMPIFMGFLAYLIVKFKAFDIKLIGAQALVVSLIILIGSQFFFIQNNTNRILTGITLLLVVGFGWMLVRSVKNEIEQKERLQTLSSNLAIANERLRELDNAKSEFISIASHQLRTPLTAIKGYISLLLEGSYGKMSPAIQDVLDKVYSVNSRLVQLVEDLLNVSRIESGRIQYAFEPTQIEPVIAELVDMFTPTAKDKHLTLQMNLSKTPLPKLTIDANKIKEVTSNLIDNALKYTKEGGVTVSVEARQDAARIIVADTGIGIHPEDMKNLFQKFLRSKETTKMVVSGAGLGLYVGRNFIEAHGGKVWAESDGENTGSRFIIELPFINPNVNKTTIASFGESYKR